VSRFRYLGDRLWLAAAALYAVNRLCVKQLGVTGFMHDHFNDLLLIPAALPVVLALHRMLGWRLNDRMPSVWEVVLHWVVWAAVCEWFGPAVFHRGVADPADVVAYLAGGIFSWGWWNRGALRFAAARSRGF